MILDEASLAGTGSLDRITHVAAQAGAKVLCEVLDVETEDPFVEGEAVTFDCFPLWLH